jgi:hypothetical protein
MGIRPVSSVTPSAPPALHVPPSTSTHAETIATPILNIVDVFRGAFGIPLSEQRASVAPHAEPEVNPPVPQGWDIPIDDHVAARILAASSVVITF